MHFSACAVILPRHANHALIRVCQLNSCLRASSAEYRCKQFGPRSGPTKRRGRSRSELFDILIVFLKYFFETVNCTPAGVHYNHCASPSVHVQLVKMPILKKSHHMTKRMQNYPVCKKLTVLPCVWTCCLNAVPVSFPLGTISRI